MLTMREKKVTICILLTLATIILGAGILMYRGSLSSIQTPKKQASRKVNPSHKYCQIPNIREMHIERNLKDSNLKKMSFQRLDPILKGVSARLLSLRAKWVFTHPNVGEANPRYLEHIISSLCSIPEPKILQKNKYEDGVYSIKIKMKEVIHLGNKKREHTERYLSFSLEKAYLIGK